MVEVGDAAYQSAIKQLLHYGIAEAFDVHDGTAAEVEQALAQLGGAVDVDAAVVDFAFDADDFAVAFGAMCGKDEVLRSPGVFGVFDDFNDFGDDVAAALNFDPVEKLEAEALDEVGVVEGGAADGGAADEGGGEFGDGGELAGAAHLHGDFADLGDAGFGGELVGDGPAGGAAGVAEALLGGVPVDFEDHAVDFIAECSAVGFGLVDEGDHLFDVRDQLAVGVDAEAEGGEGVERGALALLKVFAVDQQKVREEDKPAIGNDAGLKRAQCAGRCVARIDGGGKTLLFALFIEALEGGFGHDYFAADFESPREADLFQRFGGK